MDWLIPTIILLAIVASAWWIRSSLLAKLAERKDDQSMALLQNQVNALSTQVAQSLDSTRKSMDDRLDNAARVISGVSQQLGQLDKSSQRIAEIGKDISGLQAVLQSPKLRGNLSELFLGELLAQVLPPEQYKLQYKFKGGEAVDAIICLKEGMVPVDAKFPLENFKLNLAASTDEGRKAARKSFMKDVKKHVDDIAEKYIRTDEGTFDFALMYIPAENVYYESIIRDEELGGEMALFNYALTRRVIPVSPNSFYAYLQTVLLGLKGMKVEESAREMLNRLASLRKEFERFEDDFRLVGTHLDNSVKKFQDAEKRFTRLDGRLEQIDGMAKELEVKEPAALPEGTSEK